MTLYNSLKTTAKAAIVIAAGIMAYYTINYLRDKPLESRCEEFEVQFKKSPRNLLDLDRLIIKENGWEYAIASEKEKEKFNNKRKKANHIVLVEMLED